MECSVFSPCGRYVVHFQSDGKSHLNLEVRPKQSAVQTSAVELRPGDEGEFISTATSPPASESLFASLDESHVQELTTAAGVRKSLKNFSEMMYRALIGRTACVKFYVESCAEMKRRIGLDIRRRRQQQQQGSSHQKDEPKEEEVADEVNTTINLSVNSDVAEEIFSQRFFTMDYDVDFTRAVFPIPLSSTQGGIPGGDDQHREHSQSLASTKNARGGSTVEAPADPMNGPSALHLARASSPGVLERSLSEALHSLEKARNANSKLKRENEALIRLSKEKMLEMQRLCEDFQSHVNATSEVEKLRAKNTELRMKLRMVEEERDAALHALAVERGNPSRRSRSRSHVGKDAAGSQPRRWLLPTPPRGSTSRRVGSVGSSGSAKAIGRRPTRFDTPPAPPRRSPQRRSTSRGGRRGERGGGGEAPAPDGRTGGRSARKGSSRSEERLSQCGSSGSSRCSSVQHERLYRTPTVSSQFRQTLKSPIQRYVGDYASSRRAVFR
ncbi:unnamed protein product [Phytomonas sp. EM1]|nr:unnamed protein product [Phytomonas sp. EM1]|eukprot:CCW62050.1 unnamed protein product [Phytomonas sp. isolate EM1]